MASPVQAAACHRVRPEDPHQVILVTGRISTRRVTLTTGTAAKLIIDQRIMPLCANHIQTTGSKRFCLAGRHLVCNFLMLDLFSILETHVQITAN